MEILSKSTEETKKLAGGIAKELKPGAVLALYGDLGSGKTTFTTFLVHALGIEKRVQSPTFVILRKYSKDGGGGISNVNHLDLYRLQGAEEVLDLDIAEIFGEPNSITVIEWPEVVESFLPQNTKKIYFEYASDDERKIRVQD